MLGCVSQHLEDIEGGLGDERAEVGMGVGKRCGGGKARVNTVFVLEDVGRDDAHEIGEGHAEGGEHYPAAFVRDVVVVPYV